MPSYALQNFDPSKQSYRGSRIRWLRWVQNGVGLFAFVAFLAGFMLLWRSHSTPRGSATGWVLCGTALVAIVIQFGTTLLDWRLFGRAIRKEFPRANAKIKAREPFSFQRHLSRRLFYGVRLRGEMSDGDVTREMEIIPSLTRGWNTPGDRDYYLAARIRSDGLCEVALDPEQPDRAYLLPWS